MSAQTYQDLDNLSTEGYDVGISGESQLGTGAQITSIIGADYRFRLHSPNNYNPERAICHIMAYYDRDSDGVIDDEISCGTGFLIGPSTIMTCAHIVFNKSNYLDTSENAVWCEYANVRVARDENTLPYGTQRSTIMHLSTGVQFNIFFI